MAVRGETLAFGCEQALSSKSASAELAGGKGPWSVSETPRQGDNRRGEKKTSSKWGQELRIKNNEQDRSRIVNLENVLLVAKGEGVGRGMEQRLGLAGVSFYVQNG